MIKNRISFTVQLGNISSQNLLDTSDNSTSTNTGTVAVTVGSSDAARFRDNNAKHKKVRALQATHWDHSVYSLSIARTAFGASVVRRCCPDSDERTASINYNREVVIIAGGRGGRKLGNASTSSTTVLNSIEVFDPNHNTQAQLCPHRLHVARCSCGAFTASTNFIRIFRRERSTRFRYIGSDTK